MWYDNKSNVVNLLEFLMDCELVTVVENRIFYMVIRGEYPNYLKDRKRQKNIEDAWNF